MAVSSGTYTFTYGRDQIIKAALRKLGAYESGETPPANEIQDAADALNGMVKGWQGLGIHVWTEEEAILFLQPNQYLYSLGDGSTDNTSDWQQWSSTTLTATGANGAGVVTVGAITGQNAQTATLASGQFIGIALDSGGLFWTTINGAPAGSNVTLTAGLTSQASAGAAVYAYTTKIIRPLRVPAARRYAFTGGGNQPIEVPMIPMSRQDYMDLPNKSSPTGSGTTSPTQFYYAPRLGAAFNTQTGQIGPGIMTVWPPPTDESSAIRFTWMRPIQDFNNPADLPDLPVEWTQTLIWNLALEMGPEYDVVPQRWQIIQSRASYWYDIVTGWDREPESVYFGVAADPASR